MTEPYVPANPGDLITADNWNRMQTSIKDDIATVQANVDSVEGTVDTLQTNVGNVQRDLTAAQGDIEDAVGALKGVQGEVGEIQTEIKDARGTYKTLGERLDDMAGGGGGELEVWLNLVRAQALRDAFERKIEVYSTLFARWPEYSEYLRELMDLALAGFQLREDPDAVTPLRFVEVIGQVADQERTALESAIRYLVDKGLIDGRFFDRYAESVTHLLDLLKTLPPRVGPDEIFAVLQATNRVSLAGTMLVPIVPR